MSSDPRLDRLLHEWETARKQGRLVSVAELCRSCPELQEALQERIHVYQIERLLQPETASVALPPRWEHPPAAQTTGEPSLPDHGMVAGYRIIRERGRGGMGIVFEALDLEHHRLVALKTLKRMSPDALYRFKQEFRALADVTHPNLVPLYELISAAGTWFLAMELVEGTDFLTYLRTPPFLPETPSPTVLLRAPCSAESLTRADSSGSVVMAPHSLDGLQQPTGGSAPPSCLTPEQLGRLRAVSRQLAEGVMALHEAGKLHRDIKPSNVLVTKEGHLFLLDFGLAADLRTLAASEQGQVVGTASYMAPEQAQGLALSPASDWYSVGVMLFEALTGQRLVPGRGLRVLLEKQDRILPAPRDLVPDVPEDLDRLCVRLLSPRPEDRPTGADILRWLGGQPGGPAVHRAALPPRGLLIGREPELAALEDALAASQRGRAVTVFVRGCSGLGKTALVQCFLDRLRERGQAILLYGRCFEQESMPFKALDSLVDSLALYLGKLPRAEVEASLPRNILALARVFPVLRRVAAADVPRLAAETPDRLELRRQAFAALRELLSRLGRQRPLVLVIDDLHWGDTDSANLLAELIRPPDAPTLLLCGTYRSEARESSALLRTLFELRTRFEGALEWREIEVGVLPPAEAERLALALLDPEDPDGKACAERIARESGGNPLFLSALTQHLRDTDLAQRRLPEELSLDEVLWDRILALGAEERRVLEILAVSGRPLRQADACEAARLGGTGRTVLHHLRGALLVRGTGPRVEDDLEIFHDRLREIITARLAPGERQECHARLAVTLERSGLADPETLAIHFQGSGDRDKAGHYYARAADHAAEALAFERAAKLCRQALDLQTPGSPREQELRVKLADALANAGRGAEAAREYQASARGASSSEELDLQRRAAYHYCISGRLEEGKAALEAVLRRVGMRLPATPWRSLVSLLLGRAWLRLRGIGFRQRDASRVPAEDLERIDVAWSASAGLSMFDVVAGADFQTRNLLLSLRAGEPYRVVRALAWQAAHTSNLGVAAWPRTSRLLRAAHQLAQRIQHPHALGITLLSAGVADFTRGHWKSACSHLEAAEQILRERCTGVAWELGTAHTFSLWSRFYLGEVAEMSRQSARLLEEARERGDLYAATTLGTFTEAIARLAADDPAAARRTVTDYLQQWSQRGFHVQHMIALMSHTWIDLYRGDGPAAWKRMHHEWPALAGSRLLVVQVIRALMTYLRARSALAAATAAPSDHLLVCAERDSRQLQRERTIYGEPLARSLRAGVSALRGDRAGAVELLTSAAAGFDAAGMTLFAAAARHRLGELLGGPEGRDLQANSRTLTATQNIRDQLRWLHTLAPAHPAQEE
jgi:serine/threonine protein kinase